MWELYSRKLQSYFNCWNSYFRCGSCIQESYNHTSAIHKALLWIKIKPGSAGCLRHFGTTLRYQMQNPRVPHKKRVMSHTYKSLFTSMHESCPTSHVPHACNIPISNARHDSPAQNRVMCHTNNSHIASTRESCSTNMWHTDIKCETSGFRT